MLRVSQLEANRVDGVNMTGGGGGETEGVVYQCWPEPPPLEGPAALGAGPLEKDWPCPCWG
jgi:hypothetical protein